MALRLLNALLMHLPRWAFLFGASLGLLACQDPASQCAAPTSHDAFDVGTGESCFEPVEPGQAVPLMNGPQGGYHIWLSFGCDDCESPARVKLGARDPATNMPLAGTYDTEEKVELNGGDWPQAAGLILHMPGLDWDIENDPPPAKGSKMVLWAEVDDAGGAELHSAEVEIVVGDTVQWNPCDKDPDNSACNSI